MNGGDYDMDVLERLRHLMDERGWTVYRVARESGLSEKTVYNIYSRNTMPSIPTLEAICNAFGITLAQFFADGKLIEVSLDLEEVFENWIVLTPEQKEATLSMMRAFRREQ